MTKSCKPGSTLCGNHVILVLQGLEPCHAKMPGVKIPDIIGCAVVHANYFTKCDVQSNCFIISQRCLSVRRIITPSSVYKGFYYIHFGQ